MKYTNILEKMLCLFNIVKTSWVDILFLVIVIVSLILLFRKKISSKTCYIINVVSSIGLILFVVFNNIDVLSKMFDSIIDFTFTNIYFPSIYVYLIVLFVVNIFSILSLVHARLERKYKIVNSVSMLGINFVLAIILDIIAKNDIDLFKKESIFANTDLVVLMELSINIFLVWCVINLIMFLADNITEKIIVRNNVRKLKTNTVDMNVLNVDVNNEGVLEDYVSSAHNNENEEVKNKFIPVNMVVEDNDIDREKNHFIPVIDFINNNVVDNGFDLSGFIPKKNVVSPILNNNIDQGNNFLSNSGDLLNSILNNDLPFIIKEEKSEKDTYTLNDYRIFNKMLKDIKDHNESSRISIDKNLEYRLITKYSNETYESFKRMLKNYSN